MSSLAALRPVGWCDPVEALYLTDLESGRSPARVVSVERGAVRVATAGGACLIRGVHDLAAGDWVTLDGPRIHSVIPRWSVLRRLDPDGGAQILAANVDLVLVTAPADRLSISRVEREVVLAWDAGARPVVLVTKCDLAGPPAGWAQRLAHVDVYRVSAVTGAGLDELRNLLVHPVTAVMLGPSGAGKSTLVNALLGEDRLAVGEVRADDRRGRHTTTSRQLLPLPTGGCLIDMPGLRSLGLSADGEAVRSVFDDVSDLASGCRFSDCTHTTEPDCAVAAAVKAGELEAGRLANYQKMLREAAFENRRHDRAARAAEAKIWKARSKAFRNRPR